MLPLIHESHHNDNQTVAVLGVHSSDALVAFVVTTDAECNQVVHHIATESAPGFHVMDLQAFHGTALLAPPAISFQNLVSNYGVFFRVQLEPRLLLA